MNHPHYTPPQPEPSTPGPRNPARPADLDPETRAILDLLWQRKAARLRRLSSLTRLRGGR